MPPRKSDQGARKSDVSTSRFVVMDEDTPAAPSQAGGTTEAPAEPSKPSQSGPADVETQNSTLPQASSPKSRKDKDKEPEKKDKSDKDAVTIEDLNLPKSIITRLAKGVLEPSTQIQANAILALSKSATVFINYLATQYVLTYTLLRRTGSKF